MELSVIDSVVEAECVNPLVEADWDELIRSHPNAGFFHGSAWAKVLNKTYGHEPVYLRVARGGQLLALVPLMEVRSPWTGRRGVCLPFTDVCEPLLFADGNHKIVFEQLRNLARERKWKYFEFRGAAPDAGAKPSVAFHGHTLDLRGGPDRVAAGFDSAVRRAVRKAERNGLNVEIAHSRDAVVQFYRLHTQTRRRHGAPPQPMSFFLNIFEEVIKPGFGFVVLARHGARVAAGAMFFQFANKAIYKFGASDESLQDLRGNNLVMSEGIRHLVANHAEVLHFGRTSLSNEGLRRFKKSWGAVEDRIEYFKFDPTAGTWMSGRDKASGFHTALFSRLPGAINRLAGSLIYPHLD